MKLLLSLAAVLLSGAAVIADATAEAGAPRGAAGPVPRIDLPAR